jgi:hypothetical protein
MEHPFVAAVDRFGSGILVTFDDERAIRFSAALLYSLISQGVEIDNLDQDDMAEVGTVA